MRYKTKSQSLDIKNNTIAAWDTIMEMVQKFEKTVTKQISLNNRVHGHIIGSRGKAIHKIMNQFQVDISFPPRGVQDANIVTVTGLPNKVTKAIDHILSLEEYFMAVVPKHESQKEHMKKVTLCDLVYTPSKSFAEKYVPCTANTIQKIPDMNSSEDFPSLDPQVNPKTHPWRCK